MDWQRKRSLDSDQHPFLPRRQSIYAQTPVESRIAPEPDVPLSDYVRGSRDDICVAPWLLMGPLPAPREPVAPIVPAEPLKKCLVDFSAFSFSAPRYHDDEESRPPSSASSASGSASGRSDCSTPMTTPERDFKPLPRRSPSWPSSHPASYPLQKERPTFRASSPASSSSDSDDEYQDDDHFRAPKRKATSAPRKPAAKRPHTPVRAPSSAASSSGIVHPPLPTQPNMRGRWSCPYEDCTHETSAFGDLQRHLESLAHTPDKRHRCGACGCTFTRVDALKRHQQRRPERCKTVVRGQIKAQTRKPKAT